MDITFLAEFVNTFFSTFFVRGLIFGFTIALPVGPIGILCVRRSLVGGWSAGMLTGLGAATADAVYGSLAGFGLAGITSLLIGQRVWIQILGGLFLCYLGLHVLLSKTNVKPSASMPDSASKGYTSALFLTLTNPMTILFFTAVFAGMGLGNVGRDYTTAVWLVAGVFLGSMTWWLILSSFTSLFNARLNATAMGRINRLSGGVLTGFGLLALGECLQYLSI